MAKIKAGDDVPSSWKNWFKEDRAASAAWRKEAREAFDFAAGRHWSEEDKAQLSAELRPCITFDRSSVIVDAIAGNEIQNRQEVSYIPREAGDAIPNEIYTEAAKWFDDQAEAADEDTEAFIDSLWTGMGWTETRLDFDDDPQGSPDVDRINPLEMYWDFAATKSNLRDARRLWRVRKYTKEELLDMWPEMADDIMAADAAFWMAGDEDGDAAHIEDPFNKYGANAEIDDPETDARDPKTFTIAHFQWWAFENHWQVMNPFSGQMEEMTDSEYKEAQSKFRKVGMQMRSVKIRKRVYKQAFIGRKVIEIGPAPCENYFNWCCITGKKDRSRNTFYGLYRALKDPQQWANKWLSQVLHIMNSNAKGGLLYEQGAFVDQAQAEADWAKPHAMIELRPNALQSGKIMERPAGQFPQGFQLLTDFAFQAIREVTGVNLELLGMREASQAGVLEYQRRQAGLTVLAPLFDGLRRYRRRRGRVMLHFIDTFLADGRLIKIVGQDKAQYVPLVKQADAKYDIIVDEAPYSPNQREKVWQSLMAILPGVKDMIPPPMLLQLLEFSPLPASVTQKIKEAAEAMQQSPEAQQKAQMAARAAMAEVAVNEADAKKKEAEAQLKMAQAQAQAAQGDPQAEMMIKQAELELAKANAEVARIKVEVDEKRIDNDMIIKQGKLMLDASKQDHSEAVDAAKVEQDTGKLALEHQKTVVDLLKSISDGMNKNREIAAKLMKDED